MLIVAGDAVLVDQRSVVNIGLSLSTTVQQAKDYNCHCMKSDRFQGLVVTLRLQRITHSYAIYRDWVLRPAASYLAENLNKYKVRRH